MFGQSVPWPGGQSSGDSGETGGVPVSHTAAPRWVSTGPPISNMKGAGGRAPAAAAAMPTMRRTVSEIRSRAEGKQASESLDTQPLGSHT